MMTRTHDGRPVRMLTLIGEFTRECLAIDVERSMNHKTVLDRLADLFVHRGTPKYIRSDNGAEFTASALREWMDKVDVNTALTTGTTNVGGPKMIIYIIIGV